MTSEGDLLEGVDELVLRHLCRLCRAMKSPELRDEEKRSLVTSRSLRAMAESDPLLEAQDVQTQVASLTNLAQMELAAQNWEQGEELLRQAASGKLTPEKRWVSARHSTYRISSLRKRSGLPGARPGWPPCGLAVRAPMRVWSHNFVSLLNAYC